MKILGLNAFHGDASAAVLRDGQLVAALEEERLNRIKHWAGLPLLAAKACLEGAQPDHIAISRNPKAIDGQTGAGGAAATPLVEPTSRAVNSVRIAQVGECSRQRGCATGVPADALRRASPVAPGQRVFPVAFREAAVISIDGFGDSAA